MRVKKVLMDLILAKEHIIEGESEDAMKVINRVINSICETEGVEKPKYKSGTYDEDGDLIIDSGRYGYTAKQMKGNTDMIIFKNNKLKD
jgi:hypothetical protein